MEENEDKVVCLDKCLDWLPSGIQELNPHSVANRQSFAIQLIPRIFLGKSFYRFFCKKFPSYYQKSPKICTEIKTK